VRNAVLQVRIIGGCGGDTDDDGAAIKAEMI
jgi:hypothetical protein